MQRLMTNRPIYKIRQRLYGEAAFPIKVRPQNDELLSSWLIRTALEHKTLPTTFTNLYLPETKNRLWATDIELQADEELLARLSVKTAQSTESLRQMTFRAYEGVLFERLFPATGGTPFLLKLAMRGRWCRSSGIRWCPLCLSEEERPYFRKKWRLAIFSVCLNHRRQLIDRCCCGKALTLYKANWENNKPCCPTCGNSLADVDSIDQLEVSVNVVEAQEQFQRFIEDGYVMMSGIPVYAHQYFAVLHQVMKVMLSRRYGPRLREAIPVGAQTTIFEYKRFQSFETQGLERQETLLQKGKWLLDQWPERFAGICRISGLRNTELLKDMRAVPWWYWKAVMMNTPSGAVRSSDTR